MALRVALTSSMTRATTTLNRKRLDQARARRGRSRWVSRAQRDVPGARVRADRRGDVAGQPPRPGQEPRRARGRDVRPVDVVLGRAGEDHGQPDGVDAVLGQLVGQPHQVAARLAHRRAVHDDHALVQQRGERLDEVDHAQVVQHLGEEPGVQQVQDRVRDAADVLVDRQPRPRLLGVERHVVAVRATRSAGSTTTSRRTCPSCRCRACAGPPHCGQSTLTQSRRPAQRRRALGLQVQALGRRQRRPAAGRPAPDLAARRAVDDRDRRAPVPLPRDQPVAQPVVRRRRRPAPCRPGPR